MQNKVDVITIDGPSGTGKGTLSQLLARHLGWHFLDSGAIYRVLALDVLKKKLDDSDLDAIVQCAQGLPLRFEARDGQIRVFLADEDVTFAIREESCGQQASKIAALAPVREALLNRQREFAAPPGLVTDGRDMGTVVFPLATLKIFLTASQEARAQRRYRQLQEGQINVSFASVVEELKKRDERDQNRAHAPLRPADDAKIVDTTGLTVDQVFQIVLQLANQAGITAK